MQRGRRGNSSLTRWQMRRQHADSMHAVPVTFQPPTHRQTLPYSRLMSVLDIGSMREVRRTDACTHARLPRCIMPSKLLQPLPPPPHLPHPTPTTHPPKTARGLPHRPLLLRGDAARQAGPGGGQPAGARRRQPRRAAGGAAAARGRARQLVGRRGGLLWGFGGVRIEQGLCCI